MASKAHIRDIDQGAKKRVAEFMKAKSRVTVGIHSDAGAETYEKGGATVVEVASFHELGIGVPRRSFLADWIDERHGEIEHAIKASAITYARGRATLQAALGQLGSWAKGSIQSRISDNIPPPLAESTIKSKGSSVALIDTGHLRSAIDYKVDGK